MFNLFKKNKRGELTTQQIIELIILIVSFGIILFLIFRLNLGETSDKEICHNSVVLKAKSPLGGEVDCKTNYVCISGGGDCENFNPSTTIEVDADNQTQIMKAIAEEMVDCWWMFGEGKLNYASTAIVEEHTCSICSFIAFDEKIVEEFSKKPLDYTLFYDFLKNPKSRQQTYLQYLYGAGEVKDISHKFVVENYLSNQLEFDKQYMIVTSVYEENFFTNILEIGLFHEFFGLKEDEDYIGPPIILEKSSQGYDKLKCSVFLTKS